MTQQLEIAQLGNPILRQNAQPVKNLSEKTFQDLIDALVATAASANGVGIAAPQISQSYRLFIVASRPSPRYPNAPQMKPTAMINPRIISHSEEKVKGWEGCLSVPGLRGLVPRYHAIAVEYLDRQGNLQHQELTDFVARIFQHELDHLDGIVFVDRLESSLDLYTEQEYQNQLTGNREQGTVSNDKKTVIGIDLGGTAIKLGKFLSDGTCLETITIPTPQPATPQAVVESIVTEVKQLNRENNCIAIGLGTPGPADAAGRIAKVAINLSGWLEVPLADWLEKATNLPTIIANDANCAGLGEAWLGAGKDFKNLILLTLGTGVGGAIILDGKLFTGHKGAAGELGLITLNPDGPPCNSGNQGSLEQYASIQGIRRQTGKEPIELGKLAQEGDPTALSFWQQYGQTLGTGIASLIYILTPEAIIIGGGVSASAKFFFPAMKAEIEQRVLSSSREGLQILEAKLGNNAGMVGAAKLAWQNLIME